MLHGQWHELSVCPCLWIQSLGHLSVGCMCKAAESNAADHLTSTLFAVQESLWLLQWNTQAV